MSRKRQIAFGNAAGDMQHEEVRKEMVPEARLELAPHLWD